MIPDATPVRRTWLDGGAPFVAEVTDPIEWRRFMAERLGVGLHLGDALPDDAPHPARPRRHRRNEATAVVAVALIWIGLVATSGLLLLGLVELARLLWLALGGVSL